MTTGRINQVTSQSGTIGEQTQTPWAKGAPSPGGKARCNTVSFTDLHLCCFAARQGPGRGALASARDWKMLSQHIATRWRGANTDSEFCHRRRRAQNQWTRFPRGEPDAQTALSVIVAYLSVSHGAQSKSSFR